MAIPTLVSVTPNAGLTGGRTLVTLNGTGFQLPAPPPPRGPVPVPPPSLRVRFGALESPRAYAVSSVLAFAVVPPHAKGIVAVTVENIDPSGVLIPGETVTLPGAYAFKLPDLTRESRVAAVVRVLLNMLKREVLENVALTVHTEYDNDSSDLLNIIDIGKLPVLLLLGPEVPTNRFYTRNARQQIQNSDGSFSVLRASDAVDLGFTILGATDSMVELLNLLTATRAFFENNTHVLLPVDPADASKGVLRFELALSFEGLAANNKPNESNVRQFQGVFVVRGVSTTDAVDVVERGRPVVDYVPEVAGGDVTLHLPDGSEVVLSAPSYTSAEASRQQAWPVILGSGAASVTPESTPVDGVDFEQYRTGDEP